MRESTDIGKPTFHFFKQIGVQDNPYLKAKDFILSDDSMIINYKYYESIGSTRLW